MVIQPTVVDGVVLAWQRLSSTVVHQDEGFEVRRDKVVQPDGSQGVYVHVVAPAAVTVLALRDDDQVVLTRQWVYTHGGSQWRLPCGAVASTDDGVEAAARRELAEAVGLRAERWEQIGQVHCADSLSNFADHLFLARGLSKTKVGRKHDDANHGVRVVPFQAAVDLVQQGDLPHAGSAHAVLALAVRRATQGALATA